MALLYDYTYLNANGYLNKFRTALNAPLLDRATLTKLLKIFDSRHKYDFNRFIVADGNGNKCLYAKRTLNMILGIDETGYQRVNPKQNRYLDELKDILAGIEEKEIMGERPAVKKEYEPVDYSSPEENMDYMSAKLANLEEGKKRTVKNDKGETVPEKCDKCGGDVVCQIHGEPVYVCKDCGKYFGTMPCNVSEKKKSRNIIITESQFDYLQHKLDEQYFVETNKVKVVEKYLDDNFVRGGMPAIGEDGYPKTIGVVGLKFKDGSVAKNMTATQLFYLLQDKFNKIYEDPKQRDAFLKKIVVDWYYKRIKNGLLSKNNY